MNTQGLAPFDSCCPNRQLLPRLTLLSRAYACAPAAATTIPPISSTTCRKLSTTLFFPATNDVAAAAAVLVAVADVDSTDELDE